MNTNELVQAAAHIAAGMFGAVFAKGRPGSEPLAPEIIGHIAKSSIAIVRAIESEAKRSE